MTTEALEHRLKNLALLGLDVDGVFTDGRFWLDEDGRELKSFHTQDGYGLRKLLDAGIEVVVITGRRSGAVSSRMRELGIEHVLQGVRDKRGHLERLCGELNIDVANAAFVGDDEPDLACMDACGLSIAVANAVPTVKQSVDWVTTSAGGHGAIREIAERILSARV